MSHSIQRAMDRRTARGKELADRLNRETILKQMPQVYFVYDAYATNYRVGRTDWSGDTFNIVEKADFEAFKKVLTGLNLPLHDLTDDLDCSQWHKLQNE